MPETVKRKRTIPAPDAKPHKEVCAERFVLVDETGRERAHLTAMKDETVLAMYDPRGGLRLALHAGEREAVINIFDKYAGTDKDRRGDTIELVRLGYDINIKDAEAGLHIFNSDEDERLSLRVDDRGGLALITAPNGQYASLDGDGLAIYDENNKALAEYAVPGVTSLATPSDAAAEADEDKVFAHQRLDEATQKFIQDRERFVAAVWQRLSPEENEQGWREYSELCARVFQGGRLWSPEWVWILTVVFRLIEEDMQESANESINGFPTLELLQRMVALFSGTEGFSEAEDDTGRRLAGYLTADAQPYPAQAEAQAA